MENTFYALSSVALIVGGGWAIYQMYIFRQREWILQITAAIDVLARSNGATRIVLTIALTNVGKVEIRPAPRGLEVTIGQLPTIGTPPQVHFFGDAAILIGPFDMLAPNYKNVEKNSYVGEYTLEPGSTYNEKVCLTVPSEAQLAIKMQFHVFRGSCLTEYVYVTISQPKA